MRKPTEPVTPDGSEPPADDPAATGPRRPRVRARGGQHVVLPVPSTDDEPPPFPAPVQAAPNQEAPSSSGSPASSGEDAGTEAD